MGREERNKRRGRGLEPWDQILLQVALLPSSINGAKPQFSVASFKVTLGISGFPFLSSSLCPCLVTGQVSTGRVLGSKEHK